MQKAGLVALSVLLALLIPSLPQLEAQEIPGRCPYGHEALQGVPLAVVRPEKPQFVVECQRCGAKDFRLITDEERVRDPEWAREAMDPASFELPLHELISNFPVVASVGPRSPFYRQQFDEGEVWNEALLYDSAADSEDIAVAAMEFLEEMSIPYRLLKNSATSIKLELEDTGYATQVSIRCMRGLGVCKDGTRICSDASTSESAICSVHVKRQWNPRNAAGRVLPGRSRAEGHGRGDRRHR